jgi:hypothetical protein
MMRQRMWRHSSVPAQISVLMMVALGMLALWTFFHQLGEGSLYDGGEATYRQVAQRES